MTTTAKNLRELCQIKAKTTIGVSSLSPTAAKTAAELCEIEHTAPYKIILVWGAMCGFAGLVRTPLTAVICVASML